MTLVFALICLILSLIGVFAWYGFYQLPQQELKRRAKAGSKAARSLYQAVSYGHSFRLLLGGMSGLFGALAIVLLAAALPPLVILLVAVVVLWLVFAWLPGAHAARLSRQSAVLAAPAILWLLIYLHPALSRLGDVLHGSRPVWNGHTGLFERDDVLDLVDRQEMQADNRLTPEELDIVRHALTFNDRRVRDVLLPRAESRAVLADETVGPIFIDELHKQSLRYIPVREKQKGPIVGLLDVQDLGLKSSGTVRELMNPTVYYLHENDTLAQALHALYVTNHPVFVVVDGEETYLGLITIDLLLRQLLGHVPGNDFDQYNDPSAVAARYREDQPALEADILTEEVVQ